MPNTVKDKDDIYLEQIIKVWTCFKSFQTTDERQELVDFLDIISRLKQNKEDDMAIKIALNNKYLMEFIGYENFEYLIRLIKVIATTKSMVLKDKMVELVEGFSR